MERDFTTPPGIIDGVVGRVEDVINRSNNDETPDNVPTIGSAIIGPDASDKYDTRSCIEMTLGDGHRYRYYYTEGKTVRLW